MTRRRLEIKYSHNPPLSKHKTLAHPRSVCRASSNHSRHPESEWISENDTGNYKRNPFSCSAFLLKQNKTDKFDFVSVTVPNVSLSIVKIKGCSISCNMLGSWPKGKMRTRFSRSWTSSSKCYLWNVSRLSFWFRGSPTDLCWKKYGRLYCKI